jgi:hypothetical protein
LLVHDGETLEEGEDQSIGETGKKRQTETGEDPNIYGPNELKKPRVSLKEAGRIWARPFYML